MILAGVSPTMRFASAPMARIFFVPRSMATTEGSSITIPRPRTMTSVLAVPRSIAISCERNPNKLESGLKNAKSADLSRYQRHACCERYVQYTESIGERDSPSNLCLMKAPPIYLSRYLHFIQTRTAELDERQELALPQQNDVLAGGR